MVYRTAATSVEVPAEEAPAAEETAPPPDPGGKRELAAAAVAAGVLFSISLAAARAALAPLDDFLLVGDLGGDLGGLPPLDGDLGGLFCRSRSWS